MGNFRTDPYGWPVMPDYLKTDDTYNYIFEPLTLEQLRECYLICEQQKRHCNINSVFQPLIDTDMREIIFHIKNKKQNGR